MTTFLYWEAKVQYWMYVEKGSRYAATVKARIDDAVSWNEKRDLSALKYHYLMEALCRSRPSDSI